MYRDSELALQRLLEEPSVFGWEAGSVMEAVGGQVRTPQGQPGDEESDSFWMIHQRMVNRLLLNVSSCQGRSDEV